MTDNYEFQESIVEQSLDDETVFSSKQINYIVDINNSVYTSQGLCLIQYNLQNIYQNQSYINNEMFLVIPVTMCYNITQKLNNTPLDLTSNNFPWWSLLAFKNGNHHLIHQCELISDNFSIQEAIPFVNLKTHYEILTKFSQDDLRKYGPSIGMYELDNYKSMIYNKTNLNSGDGMTNNRPFNIEDNLELMPTDFMSSGIKMNDNVCNTSLNQRLNKYVTLDGANNNNFYGENTQSSFYLKGKDDLAKEFKPFVTLSSDKKSCYYVDYMVIKLKDLLNAVEKMPLTKRLNMKLNIYCNVGSGCVDVTGTSDTNTNIKLLQYKFNNEANTIQHTCPLLVNYMNESPLFVNYAATTNDSCKINYSLFIGDPKNINIGGINCLFSDGANFTILKNSRLYFYQYILRSDMASLYMEKHIEKTIVYKKYMYNQDNGVPAGSSYSKLISSGIKNPIAIMIFPFISKSNSTNTLKVSQYTSPFDTCPSTSGPLTLYNLNVVLGGVNVLTSQIDLNFDAFMSQVNNINSVMSNSWGVSNGLLSQKYWEEAYKNYYIDLSRCNKSDRNVFRSLELKFVNLNKVDIDLIYIIIYDGVANLNTQTGMWSNV